METVTVEGGAPLVNTETPEVGTVIDCNFVEPAAERSENSLVFGRYNAAQACRT